jgi:deoxyribodipyrimidine photo-lyase
VRTAVVLFTRDLRVHDNPALHRACATADRVVPLFVLDSAVPSSPNRDRFLAESLADLRRSLRERGGDLVVRRGDPVREAMSVATAVDATLITMAADVSAHAARRQRRLAAATQAHRVELVLADGVTIVPPGVLRPSGGGQFYRVFTPYWRAWRALPRRAVLAAPRRVHLPTRLAVGRLPAVGGAGCSAHAPRGGESAARRRLAAWLPGASAYPEIHNDLAADATSRLSAYLHFGCLSPLAVAAAVTDAEEYVRQLCWRDFFHQVLAGFPDLPRRPLRSGAADVWRDDPAALAAWQEGRTGVPIVDAGMRQLLDEGFMHNRARLITASHLTRTLGLDWRLGAAWFARWLVDADVANNWGNWQWVAGTGTDTKPYRRFSPDRQALRFDPDGGYVGRWVRQRRRETGAPTHAT